MSAEPKLKAQGEREFYSDPPRSERESEANKVPTQNDWTGPDLLLPLFLPFFSPLL